MKKVIRVKYWYHDFSELTGIKEEIPFVYSKDKLYKLIDLFLYYGFEIMIRKFDECIYLFIDNSGGRFSQR